MSTYEFQELLASFIHHFGGLVEFFMAPRDLGALGDYSLIQLMLGSGITIYLVYQFATWLGNLIT